ncbi:MAG: hypothetical protein AAF639_30705 [Chloroflexota bacterium]
MYISRRTGGGRGVYEVAGRTHDNLSPSDIQEREFVIRLEKIYPCTPFTTTE